MRRFAAVRFDGYLERAKRAGFAAATPSDADCWHRFESHFILTRTLAGKSYKRWLFDRVRRLNGGAIDIVESGASLIVREVVRVYVQEERCRDERLDAMPGEGTWAVGGRGAPSGLTAKDLLQAPSDTRAAVDAQVRQTLAGEMAAALFEQTDRGERWALAARGLDLPFSDATLERASGLAKSRLYQLFNHVVLEVARQVENRLPATDRDERVPLGACLLECLYDRAVQWARLEKSCPRPFKGLKVVGRK